MAFLPLLEWRGNKMIEFRQVSKRYPNGFEALKNVSLTIGQGEFVAIIGLSGAGKSTLIRTINRMHDITEGMLTVDGTDVMGLHGKSLRAFRRRIGMIFQSFNLITRTTVIKNVLTAFVPDLPWWRAAFGIFTKEEKIKALEALDKVGILDKAFVRADQLSGGQQQRVAIGRALVYNPPVILLDEPLSNLDAKLREEARVFLRELIVKLGLSALMVTHDQNEAMAISDRILLLNNGVIEQQGTPQEMYGSPRTLFAAEFMGSNNRLHGTVTDLDNGRARIEGASWALWGMAGEGVSVGAEATAVIRVERLRIASSPEENMLELALLTSMYLGDRWEYLFRTEGDDFAIRAYGSALRDAERCHLTLPVNDLWIFPKG